MIGTRSVSEELAELLANASGCDVDNNALRRAELQVAQSGRSGLALTTMRVATARGFALETAFCQGKP
jgi:hypothetical protein